MISEARDWKSAARAASAIRYARFASRKRCKSNRCKLHPLIAKTAPVRIASESNAKSESLLPVGRPEVKFASFADYKKRECFVAEGSAKRTR